MRMSLLPIKQNLIPEDIALLFLYHFCTLSLSNEFIYWNIHYRMFLVLIWCNWPFNLWICYIFSFNCVFINFFHQCLIVFNVQIFHSWVKFIPNYFIVFKTIINGIVSFIFFSDKSLLVHRKQLIFICWFCILNFTVFVH